MTQNQPIRPLEGVRVLDLSRALAGAYCTMMLGDACADMLKVKPPSGDAASEATIPRESLWKASGARAVAVFLASEAASYVTGEQVRCDGGLVRHH